MAFKGLFIGVDRYSSPHINWLSCAKRDAVALHALFVDNLGGEGVLLTDAAATRVAIQEQFEFLKRYQPEDVVVVMYSGHGSETHELVTFDADVNDLSNSCISLSELTEWFSSIPASQVICVLDCCFSGGAGAKVLKVSEKPRSLPSTEHLLEQLSGEGRLLFTASNATEEAWETAKFGHGLLTYYLLEALQGVEEVRHEGKTSIYRLLDYVTRRVTDAAAQFGKSQHPTLKGAVEHELTWPVFQPGATFRAAFPERGREPVTEAIDSLSRQGFPQDLISVWAGSIPKLNALQLAAINEFHLFAGDHLVVSAPTSSGKTMIGELAALKGVLQRKRAFFLLPLRALVNDKYQQFQATYSSFGLRTIRATGEISDDIPTLMRGQYDICLMTYEKFAALVLANPYLLNQVGTIVIDEVQMIADESRGVNLEFVLTLLRVRRRQGIEPQLIALSAVIGDTNGLERWLGARLLRRNTRPVPLDEGVLRFDGSFRFLDGEKHEEKREPQYIQRQHGKGSSQEWIIPLVKRLVGEGKQVLVFRETRGEARGCANYLSDHLGLPPALEALEALPQGDPSLSSEALRKSLQGGAAFHISDLDPAERLVIENHFRAPDSKIRVIAATTTLAMGVNLPAAAVIIAGLEHPGPKPYSVAEYKNIVGRAGRLGHVEHGTSYLITMTPMDEHNKWTRYILGEPEDLHSRFVTDSTDPRSLAVRVLAAAQQSAHTALTAEEIVEFFEASFGAFQKGLLSNNWIWDRKQLNAALADLQTHEMVEKDASERYHLTALGRLAGESSVEVESVLRLVRALSGAAAEQITDPTLIAATQLTVELDQVLFPINKKSTNKEPQTWMSELSRQGIPAGVMRALQRNAQDQVQITLRTKKAVACLLWITGKPLSEIETTLTQFGGAFNGAAGPLRGLKSRTCDLLPVAVRVAEILYPGLDLTERQNKLLARLELGVPGKAVELARFAATQLSRADYQELLRAGLCTVNDADSATDSELLSCLGGDANKLAVIRNAVTAHREAEMMTPSSPILSDYEE